MNPPETRQAIPLSPVGERARVRGQRRTRTTAAREIARHLRQKSTAAEKRLWRVLRDRRFSEFKFRRQYQCGPYFLDFFCASVRLAVELDGGGHGFPGQRARDEKRNRYLAEQGIEVRRFWNHQVKQQLESVRFEIWYSLMKRSGRTAEIEHILERPSTPHLNPLPSEGRGSFRATSPVNRSTP